jgi:hypothetical protein
MQQRLAASACQRARFAYRDNTMIRTPIRAALALALSLAATATAHAHAVLIDSTPAPHAHVKAGELAIVFRYNSRVDAKRSKLTIAAGGAAPQRLQAAAGDGPDVLTATTAVTPGEWVIRWQVLAVDGHITRGSVPFTVDGK